MGACASRAGQSKGADSLAAHAAPGAHIGLNELCGSHPQFVPVWQRPTAATSYRLAETRMPCNANREASQSTAEWMVWTSP